MSLALIIESKIANEKDSLIEQFFAILILIPSFACVVDDVVEQVIQLLLNLKLTHHHLRKLIVHSHNVVKYFDRSNCKAN